MPKYYRRPDGLYETSRTVNGKRIRFRGRTCAEVDRKILEYNTEQKQGRMFPIVVNEWYALKEKEITHNTYRVYAFSVDRLAAHFKGRRIGDIQPVDVMRYVRAFEAEGYAKNTVNIELTVLKQVFSYAVLCGDIDVSPATEVHMSRNLPFTERRALTEDQEAKVESCRTGDWWLLGLMLLYTGCRRGELLALNWQDIDRSAGVIHVTKKLDYSYGNVPHMDNFLKSANGKRDIPLLAPLEAVLPRRARLGPIFTDEDGNYMTKGYIRKIWKQYCADAGLLDAHGDPSVTPHCFRHSFSTICFEAGIDPKSAAAFMGDTEKVVNDVYTELRNKHHATSAEKLNAFFEMRAAERTLAE